MKLYHTGLVIMLLILKTSAASQLSGSIQSMTISTSESPYIITDNIIVPSGQKLTIPQGCVLLFKPFTSLTIEGTLIVEGTAENPVIFTSENDTVYNHESSQFPNPFDWNGLLINQSAEEARLSNFVVQYSVFGLKSYRNEIIIENGIFSHNGQSNLTINEIMHNAGDGIPYSYLPRVPIPLAIESNKIESNNIEPQPQVQMVEISVEKEKKTISVKKKAALTCIGIGAGSFGVSAVFFALAIKDQYLYNKTSDVGEQKIYKSRRDSYRVYARIGAIPSILCAGTATILLSTDKSERKSDSKISFQPFFGESNGLAVTIPF